MLNTGMRKLNSELQFEFMSPNEDIITILENIGEPDVDGWMDDRFKSKKVLVTASIDGTMGKILRMLENSTTRERARSEIISALLVLGFREFMKATEGQDNDTSR